MFSIVMPAYNAEKSINHAINSVLNQHYTDFELIIIDDGSQDDTRNLVMRYADKRIRYIYQENAGVSAARNRGILSATRDFICFLDADDEWMDDHLTELFHLISEFPKCGMYTTGYDIRLGDGKIIHKSHQILKNVLQEHIMSENGFEFLMTYGYFLNTNTVCCRREVFNKVGLFAVGIKNGEDDDMWFRVFTYYPIAITKKATTIYDRSNCVATAHRGEVFEPVFLSRVAEILKSDEVPCFRKESLLLWIEQNKLSRARKYILLANKRNAKELLREIDYKKVNKKKYLLTVLCLFIPSKLIRKIIDKRDVGYYKH